MTIFHIGPNEASTYTKKLADGRFIGRIRVTTCRGDGAWVRYDVQEFPVRDTPAEALADANDYVLRKHPGVKVE
ncbi:MAG: hypothetical protein QM639_08465 [Rhodocyclaceae bacterium]|jgi:hypothetical protein